jgi:ketosteroid isomerase-like protein
MRGKDTSLHHDPMRLSLLPLVALALPAACSVSGGPPPAAEQHAIADSLARQIKTAYDLTQPNVEARLMSLYPTSGRVVSATAGQITTSRDSIAMGIKAFWENVGVNMREPKWVWQEMLFDVPAPNVAIMSAKYHIDHLTPRNQPHSIGGAWTAVFEKRGDRWYVIQEHLSDLPSMPDSTMAPMPMPPGHKMPPAK